MAEVCEMTGFAREALYQQRYNGQDLGALFYRVGQMLVLDADDLDAYLKAAKEADRKEQESKRAGVP